MDEQVSIPNKLSLGNRYINSDKVRKHDYKPDKVYAGYVSFLYPKSINASLLLFLIFQPCSLKWQSCSDSYHLQLAKTPSSVFLLIQ